MCCIYTGFALPSKTAALYSLTSIDLQVPTKDAIGILGLFHALHRWTRSRHGQTRLDTGCLYEASDEIHVINEMPRNSSAFFFCVLVEAKKDGTTAINTFKLFIYY